MRLVFYSLCLTFSSSQCSTVVPNSVSKCYYDIWHCCGSEDWISSHFPQKLHLTRCRIKPAAEQFAASASASAGTVKRDGGGCVRSTWLHNPSVCRVCWVLWEVKQNVFMLFLIIINELLAYFSWCCLVLDKSRTSTIVCPSVSSSMPMVQSLQQFVNLPVWPQSVQVWSFSVSGTIVHQWNVWTHPLIELVLLPW